MKDTPHCYYLVRYLCMSIKLNCRTPGFQVVCVGLLYLVCWFRETLIVVSVVFVVVVVVLVVLVLLVILILFRTSTRCICLFVVVKMTRVGDVSGWMNDDVGDVSGWMNDDVGDVSGWMDDDVGDVSGWMNDDVGCIILVLLINICC